MAGANSVRSILFALGANLSIAIAKLGAALVTGSGSMMAESIHSFADSGNQVLLLFGLKRAKRPPSDDFPLGYGKSIYFWSFVVAIILFSMGGLFSLFEGWHKLHEPQALKWPAIALGVLLFGIVAEGISFAACIKEVNKVRGDRSYWRWFVDSRQSALLVIFGEDLAALLGLVLAFAAVSLTAITGNPVYDAIGTLCIGVLLLIVAVGIGIEVKNLLIGQGVEKHIKRTMLSFLEQQADVEKVFNLLTLQLGDDVMVAVKAKMHGDCSADELIQRINVTEKAFREAFPQVQWLFFEPDNQD